LIPTDLIRLKVAVEVSFVNPYRMAGCAGRLERVRFRWNRSCGVASLDTALRAYSG